MSEWKSKRILMLEIDSWLESKYNAPDETTE